MWLLGCLGCKTGWPIYPQMQSGTIAVIFVIRFAVDLHWHSDAVDAPRNMGVVSFVGGTASLEPHQIFQPVSLHHKI